MRHEATGETSRLATSSVLTNESERPGAVHQATESLSADVPPRHLSQRSRAALLLEIRTSSEVGNPLLAGVNPTPVRQLEGQSGREGGREGGREAPMAPLALNGLALPDKRVSTVLVVIALHAEIAPLVESLKLAEDKVSVFPAGVPWVKYSGVYKNIDVHAITAGKDEVYDVDHVGTVPASLMTFAAVQAVKPDLIINAGTAGGFKRKGAEIGDVFLVTETANHDRRIPIGNFVGYGIGCLVATPAPNLVKELSLKEGKLSTGNSLDITPKDEEIILSNDAALKDMEGAAVAYVADILSVPLVLLKAVTDIVDGDRPTAVEFLENLTTAANALTNTIPKVFDYLSERNLSAL